MSTNPMGAEVYVDGKLAGKTPTEVELERTQSHVLTLVKEHYRQADVVIHRKKKTEEQLFKAINSGVSTGLFFKDPAMGMMRGMDSYNTQEETGEAYELYPSAVTVDLKPLAGAGGNSSTNSHAIQEGREAVQPEENQAAVASSDGEAFAKGVLGAAPMAGVAAMGTKEKRWETSSSTSTSVRSDGTVVTKHSSTSVGVGVNPAGVTNLIDKLYK
ncbi:MAG: PEGA domain-containing protein [Deltaproteobacteria bacterium]|nr:PEGA domain-containing protein [Deltaproteobacteria bacterium]